MFIDLRKRGGDSIINSDFIVEIQPDGNNVFLVMSTKETLTVALKSEADAKEFINLIASQTW